MPKIQRRASKDLATFLKANKSGRLLGAVDRHLRARPPEERAWKTLHPSALCKGICPRAAYFTVISDTPPAPEKIGRVTQSIFDEGHLIHAKWQGYFKEMGVLYGRWRCLYCAGTWWATSPEDCPMCGKWLIAYDEVLLENPDWLIVGHADGWIKGLGPDVLIEIKSVGTGTVRYEAPNMFEEYDGNLDEIWKNLKRPFSSHFLQGQLYLRVLNATQDDAPQEVVFLYECKSNQQAKEFVIPYDPASTQGIVDLCISVKEAVDAGVPPECPYGSCTECKGFV